MGPLEMSLRECLIDVASNHLKVTKEQMDELRAAMGEAPAEKQLHGITKCVIVLLERIHDHMRLLEEERAERRSAIPAIPVVPGPSSATSGPSPAVICLTPATTGPTPAAASDDSKTFRPAKRFAPSSQAVPTTLPSIANVVEATPSGSTASSSPRNVAWENADEPCYLVDAAPSAPPPPKKAVLPTPSGSKCPFAFCDHRFNVIDPSIGTLYGHINKDHKDLPGAFFRCSACPSFQTRAEAYMRSHYKMEQCGGRGYFDYDPSYRRLSNKRARLTADDNGLEDESLVEDPSLVADGSLFASPMEHLHGQLSTFKEEDFSREMSM